MAFTHIQFNDQLAHGRMLRQALNQLEQGRLGLMAVKATMDLMKETGSDGSQAAHFTEVFDRFGTVDAASAKGMYDEIASGLSKLTTDASVTVVQTALLQLFNKLR